MGCHVTSLCLEVSPLLGLALAATPAAAPVSVTAGGDHWRPRGGGHWRPRDRAGWSARACEGAARRLFGTTLRFCVLSADAALRDRARAAAAWEWVPAGCGVATPEPPLARSFAAALEGGRLTIVGDSMAKQHAVSLFCELYRTAVDKKATAALRAAEHTYVLRGGGRVAFVNSDRLVRLTRVAGELQAAPILADSSAAGRRDESWASRLRMGAEGARDAVVFSSGAHWSELDAVANHRVAVRGLLAYLLGPNQTRGAGRPRFEGSILYRTNFVPGCSDDAGPSAFDARWEAARDRGVETHNWRMLPAFDRVWAEELRRRELVADDPEDDPRRRLAILNVSVLTSLRGDGHVGRYAPADAASRMRNATDCLHFCLPGPIDAWNVLLRDAIARPRGCVQAGPGGGGGGPGARRGREYSVK